MSRLCPHVSSVFNNLYCFLDPTELAPPPRILLGPARPPRLSVLLWLPQRCKALLLLYCQCASVRVWMYVKDIWVRGHIPSSSRFNSNTALTHIQTHSLTHTHTLSHTHTSFATLHMHRLPRVSTVAAATRRSTPVSLLYLASFHSPT